jgi:hypothetical protein
MMTGMVGAGRYERALVLLAVSGSLLACGPGAATADGDGADDGSDDGTGDGDGDGDEPSISHPNEPLPPIDPDAWCDDPETLAPFLEREPVSRLEASGVCGHLLTWYGPQESSIWTLLHPDGTVEDLGPALQLVTNIFSPTGQLLAWAEGEISAPTAERLVLRDVQTGASRTIEIDAEVEFGFVRLPDSDHGAALWLCHDDVLQLAGIEPEDTRVLAENVRCNRVMGAELSTRLVYPDLDGVLSVVDAKDGTRWSIQTGDAASWSKLSPDGRLASDHGGGELRRIVDLDHGEVVTSCDHVTFDQALAFAAPLFVVCDDELSVWRDDALVPILGEMTWSGVTTTTDGSATFNREVGDVEEVWYVGAEDPTVAQLIISIPDETPFHFYRTLGGQYGRLIVETSECADANCTETITEVWTWTPAGLGARMLVAGEWDGMHQFDDGQMLGYGSPIEGPLPEGVPIPPRRLYISGPDGVTVATWSLDGVPRGGWALDDGRVLLLVQYGYNFYTDDFYDYVRIFDRESPMIETLLGPVYRDGNDRLDPRLGLLAYITDDPDQLYWGAVPD